MFKALIALFILCWIADKIHKSAVWAKRDKIVTAVANAVKEEDKTPTA